MTPRRTSDRKVPAPSIPTKAQQAVDKLLDRIRAKADQTPPAAKEEAEPGEARRDGHGHFAKGTKPGPGRPPGRRNKIPKSLKEVVRALGEGVLDVTFKDPATDKLVAGPVAHLLAEQLVTGLTDPKHYPAFVKMLLEYGVGKPKIQTDAGSEGRKQIPRMIFLHEPHDPMAKPGEPNHPKKIH